MKKKTLLVVLFCCMLMLSTVSANSFCFKFTLKKGVGFGTNADYIFTTGTYFVVMSFDKWYDSSCTDGKLYLELSDSSAGKVLASSVKKVYMNTSLLNKFGQFPGGYKYFSFLTKIDGKSYCGFVSNKVTVGT